MSKKTNFGDIIEIPTKNGLAYAQYTHRNEEYGALIRILDGVFQSRPRDFTDLVKRKHRFVTFFPLSAAVNRKIFEVVAHAEIPEEAITFPIFRSGTPLKDGKVHTWWLWDGDKSWQIGNLTEKQRKLPIEGIINDTALISRIESGWTPETDRRS